LTLDVRLCSARTSSGDVFLRHKTTCRDRYERLHAEARADGFAEILFQNEREEVTEGAISNIFILSKGKLFTPPVSSGLLPGIFRRHLLENDANTEERVVHLNDLESADGVFLCNAVRGIRQVASLCFDPTSGRPRRLYEQGSTSPCPRCCAPSQWSSESPRP
jgi:para-aminobenzoate synthetase/4-amino-4-deoxychorismate lyase